MVNKLPRFQKVKVLGAATVTLFCLPCLTHAQTPAQQDQQQDRQQDQQQDRQAVRGDDVMRRDVARFDQFLDNHREVADQLRKSPSLVNDPQFLQSHPELNSYLQDHPSVKQVITQHPDSFMTMEDRYGRDSKLRDRDAGGQDRDADRGNTNRDADRGNDADRRDANRDADRVNDADHRDANRDANHGNDADHRDATNQDADHRVDADRDADRRDAGDHGTVRGEQANFDRFLDSHREIAEQVRKNPSLLDDRAFVQNHPALQTYLQQNPGVRERLSQDPKGFTYHAEGNEHDANMRDHDPMHDHMADFGGFLRSHNDVRIDLSKNPSVVKDQQYVQNHTELDAYLNAHPEVRTELMANPQGFVRGAVQSGAASGGAGGNGRGASTNGTGTTGSMTGTSATPATTTHEPPKPNQ